MHGKLTLLIVYLCLFIGLAGCNSAEVAIEGEDATLEDFDKVERAALEQGVVEDSAMIDEMIVDTMPWYPLADDVTMTFMADWPQTPAVLSQYDVVSSDPLTPEQMQAYARGFGFGDTVYRARHLAFAERMPFEELDVIESENPVMIPEEMIVDEPLLEMQNEYVAFGSDATLNFFGASVAYNTMRFDWGLPQISEDEAIIAATNHLSNAGMLPEKYVAESRFAGETIFYSQADGLRMNHQLASVQVDGDGELVWLHRDFFDLVPGDSLEPISAETAWQTLEQSADLGSHITLLQPKQFEELEEPSFELAGPQFWARSYEVGELVTLYVWPTIYEPVIGSGDVLVLADQRRLIFDDVSADLLSAEVQNGSVLKIVGTIAEAGENGAINVETWQADEHPLETFAEGVYAVDAGKSIISTLDGRTLELVNPPQDLEAGTQIFAFGYTDDAGLFQWQHLNEAETYPDEEAVAEPAPASELAYIEPTTVTAIEIESAELRYETYWPEFEAIDEEDLAAVSGLAQDGLVSDLNAGTLMPVWYFIGSTDNDMLIELSVPAYESSMP